MLKETEWLTINNVLLELYAQEDFACFAQKLMRVIRMLIPYSKGYLLLRNGSRIDEQTDVVVVAEGSHVVQAHVALQVNTVHQVERLSVASRGVKVSRTGFFESLHCLASFCCSAENQYHDGSPFL